MNRIQYGLVLLKSSRKAFEIQRAKLHEMLLLRHRKGVASLQWDYRKLSVPVSVILDTFQILIDLNLVSVPGVLLYL
ncbi:hypothetical protein Nmel_001582 [Mimus melanotis]